MTIKDILDILITLVPIIGIALLFFFYFTKPKVKEITDNVLRFIPFVLTLGRKFVKDDKGKFDTYDWLTVLSRVAAKISRTIEDPTNKTFGDVEDEVFAIVRSELANYQNLPGVPDIDDPELRVQVEVVFQSIQKAMIDEDRTGDDS
jgi:hypothetical protein